MYLFFYNKTFLHYAKLYESINYARYRKRVKINEKKVSYTGQWF